MQVTLVREPQNPYDANAIRVDNVNGVQIGHINRELASKLAALTDGQVQLHLEGVATGESDWEG